jgi:hypothetical protein
MNLKVVDNLVTNDPVIDQRWLTTSRWLREEELYANLPPCNAAQLPTTRFTRSELVQMATVPKIRRIHPSQVKGAVLLFDKPEPKCDTHADRRRILGHTKDANDVNGRDILIGVPQTQRHELHPIYVKCSWAATFDYSAYFDQIDYTSAIGERFCFRDSSGDTWCLVAASMGHRPVPELAGAATWKLCTFRLPSGKEFHAGVVIDNTIFLTEDRETLEEVIEIWYARVTSANVTVNNISSCDEAKKCITQKFKFAGEEVDLENKTVRCIEKTINKAKFCWTRQGEWTYRQHAAMYGCLFHMTNVLHHSPAPYYNAILHYRRTAQLLECNPQLWDTKIPSMDTTAITELEAWYRAVVANEESRILIAELQPATATATSVGEGSTKILRREDNPLLETGDGTL